MLSLIALAGTSAAQATWQLAYPVGPTPPTTGEWRVAFDEANAAALLMFPGGGQPGNSFWRWNGAAWDQPNALTPPHRSDCYLAYDVARQRTVLYGGMGQTGFLQEVWEWNGTVWQLRPVSSFPAPRIHGAFAFDRVRNVCVLFGGTDPGATSWPTDTWEWNGTTWTQAAPAVHPSGRQNHAMTFDPSSGRVLLFGGMNSTGVYVNDTWTWDGATWVQQQPATPPFTRAWSTMASDLARSRVVLYGGNSYDYQTWEWDGAQWHASLPGSPAPLTGHSMTYDTQRSEVLSLGGQSPIYVSNSEVWRYRTNAPATATTFGVGCAGTTGTPSLANAPYSLPWLGDTVRTRVANIAQNSIGSLFVTAFAPSFLPMSLAPLGAPGCGLYLQPDAIEFRTAVGSVVDWTLAIPSTPSLVGVAVYQQALPVDPPANPLGLTATNGLRLQIGMR